ncbi:GNAT family N-acetyltransferase [Psychrobacillus vulpis]|uniref:GNAT family N-acetyltransferase n=1 Tax=Psychrobacillus vulpis TaxID=2325572 RepID=A0A544TPT8_9BACI|nr:GNAT family N-acetyltransferase [Psychrobacillus vulpis]TQR19466.1 GNAT family N-acetyltransferase [Psychrobacillus vulpis]
MKEINTIILPLSIRELLTYATSASKIDQEYDLYLQLENRLLYGYKENEKFIGCIGFELTATNNCEIKHIAVSPLERGRGIGKWMIDNICEKYSLQLILAETDLDAVSFYRKLGFTILSLGEKYPGVERFRCEYRKTE